MSKEPNGEAPLLAAFRVSVSSIFDSSVSVSQDVNETIFAEPLEIYLKKDLTLCNNSSGKFDKSLISCTNLKRKFSNKKSKTLGFLRAWILARFSGKEAAAYLDCTDFRLHGESCTIGELREDIFKDIDVESKKKPLVFILDEFNIAKVSESNEKLFFFRNLLRVCNFSLILMGTDRKASNMSVELALGSMESGSNYIPWCQVFTNIFSCKNADLLLSNHSNALTKISAALPHRDSQLFLAWLKVGTVGVLVSWLLFWMQLLRLPQPILLIWHVRD